jgi:hypothetical protein
VQGTSRATADAAEATMALSAMAYARMGRRSPWILGQRWRRESEVESVTAAVIATANALECPACANPIR